MELIEIDGTDRGLFERYRRMIEAVHRSDSEFPTVMGLEEAWVWYSGTHRDARSWGLAAVEGDTWFGTAALVEELLENTHILDVDIRVDPTHRRRGVGTRLLQAVEDIAREHGRTMLQAEVVTPYDGATVASTGTAFASTGTAFASAGTAFAERHGFVRKHVELHQVMEFPLPDADLDPIAAEIATKHTSYRLIQWDDDCPDEWVDEFCDLLSLMSTEVPHGELEVEPEVWTVERLREMEARHRAQNRIAATTAAATPDGALVAYTKMGTTTTNPSVMYQADTLVRPEHRGHRLGMAVKIVNMRALQARVRGSAVLHTWNAPENAPMIAVNDALGFRPVENNCEYQRKL